MQVVAVVEHKHQLDQDHQVELEVAELVDIDHLMQEQPTLVVAEAEQVEVVDH
tara:strand:+ start:396 stop:554 length:159 start_codon:yes stop_codon:yes gene_type:complete